MKILLKNLQEIEDRIMELKKCLISYDTLIEFNKEKPDRAEPFYFVFVQ